ncbi:MAG: ABC transporter permease [Pseudomonadota bacterium]
MRQFLAIVAESWRAMTMNPLRTGLTMLGMIIGVAAVVLMLAIGQGARTKVNEAIASMGSNLFIVMSGTSTSGGVRMGSGTTPTLTIDDAQAIATLPGIARVAPLYSGAAQLVYSGSNWTTQVYGTTPDYLAIREWALEAGRVFDAGDLKTASRVALIGQTASKNLFGDENPLGRTLRIKNSPYLVIGILAPKGQSLDGRDQDDVVLIPLTTAQNKLFGNPFPGTVRFMMAQARSPELMREAEADMNRLLRARHRLPEGVENDFTVRDLTAIAQGAAMAAQAMSLMLGAIASISLLVGGIGIMNIMLVSVTERTREIGVRMAIGARRRDILLQFLLEAVMICLIGGLAGLGLGGLGAWAASTGLEMDVELTLFSMLLAFSFSAAIGIFFGFYPARRAAGLKPVEALRYE